MCIQLLPIVIAPVYLVIDIKDVTDNVNDAIDHIYVAEAVAVYNLIVPLVPDRFHHIGVLATIGLRTHQLKLSFVL